MKKAIIIVLTVVMISTMIKSDNIIIPSEAIRLRVIANSDSGSDQELKLEVKNRLESSLYNYLYGKNNLQEARETIQDNLNNIKTIVNTTLTSNNVPYGYNVNYGLNYFPAKEFKGTIYEEGEYESLVVTLGEGAGNNWWCVLFPPLCLLEAEEGEQEEIEYQSFVKKLIDKYLK